MSMKIVDDGSRMDLGEKRVKPVIKARASYHGFNIL
jgi:hypothetical protein